MRTMKYYDKKGRQIDAGMTVRMPDGTLEKVHELEGEYLGYCATNPDYKRNHPEAEDEYYCFSGKVQKVRGSPIGTVVCSVNCTICGEEQEPTENRMTPYVVDVTEKTVKRIVTYAEDYEAAFEAAEELANTDKLDMLRFWDFTRDVEVVREADDEDLEKYTVYKEDEA